MNPIRIALVLTLAFAAQAYADGPNQAAQTTETQRDVNQQQRIENGLDSGQLSTREAGRLEREESHVDRMEAHASADGQISAAEAQRIGAAQNAVSHDIYAQKHDAQVGNPDSASSQHMQADVQRNVNEEQRINQGVASGQLTTREAGRLERGQAHVANAQANAAANGHVSAAESAHLQRASNRQSRHIYHQKHDAQAREGAHATN